MERNFCSYFGATPTLPRIKNNPRTKAPEPETSKNAEVEIEGMTEEVRLERLKEVYASARG